jgi:hypothetical protein
MIGEIAEPIGILIPVVERIRYALQAISKVVDVWKTETHFSVRNHIQGFSRSDRLSPECKIVRDPADIGRSPTDGSHYYLIR